MPKENGECEREACGCVSDPVVPRGLDQIGMTFIARQNAAAATAIDIQNNLQMQFNVGAAQQLERSPTDDLNTQLASVASIINTVSQSFKGHAAA